MGPATRILIGANVLVFALQSVLGGDSLVLNFALWPLGRFPVSGLDTEVGFHFWQLITSAFLHGSVSLCS